MANPYGSQYQQNMGNMQPIQTQNPQAQQRMPPQQQQQQQQQPQQPIARPFSPPSYHQPPGAMSPNMGSVPPAKRPRMSPHPQSPYSPFNASPYGPPQSPYGAPPPVNQYSNSPQPLAAPYQAPSSFHQPQPYQPYPHNQANAPMTPQPPPQVSMPPPKVPASKAQDGELEKSNPRDMDVNNISDVLTGSGIDLREEEEYLTHSFVRNQDNSFYSQGSASTISPHGSFNNWNQGAGGHGAFQGTGPLSQTPMTQSEQEAELLRKHERAARALNEVSAAPLADPFLKAGNVRQRIAASAYQCGISVNLEGVFDKIPDAPQAVKRTTVSGPRGESIVALQADSILKPNAPFVDILSLLSLAAEDRARTILEDAFALAQNRQHTSDGVVPPNLADLADASKEARSTTAVPTNLTKTAWEATDDTLSPATVTASNGVARLPTPPTEPTSTPQLTIAFSNPVAVALGKRARDDLEYEKARIAKRQKRLAGTSAAAAEVPVAVPVIEKLTKKERDRLNKANTSEESLHRQANMTASLAIGGKKKYSWMTGGGGGGGGGSGLGSGASTPARASVAPGAVGSGASTPAAPKVEAGLQGERRTFGAPLEKDDTGRKIQLRDVIHVLDVDGRHRKTLVTLLSRPKGTTKEEDKQVTAAAKAQKEKEARDKKTSPAVSAH